MTVFRAPDDYPRWPAVADLIHRSFAWMTPILGHPARAMQVTPETLKSAAEKSPAWLAEDHAQPVACLFARPSRDHRDALYLGWLAVDGAHRGRGLARALVAAADHEARRQGCTALTLDTGRELVHLHNLFLRLGFEMLGERDAVVSFLKPLAPPDDVPR